MPYQSNKRLAFKQPRKYSMQKEIEISLKDWEVWIMEDDPDKRKNPDLFYMWLSPILDYGANKNHPFENIKIGKSIFENFSDQTLLQYQDMISDIQKQRREKQKNESTV